MMSLAASYSIKDDKNLISASTLPAVICSGHSLIKLPSDGDPETRADETVYYCGVDGKKYAFPNRKTFLSWHKDFSSVAIVSPGDLASIPLGGNVTYKPGSRLLKTQNDPKTYVVGANGTLHPIPDEMTAQKLYGADWNTRIDDVPATFFADYKIDSVSALADDPNSQCSLTFADSYLRADVRAVAEIRGDLPGINWQKGWALTSDGNGRLTKVFNAGDLRAGDYSLTYRGFASANEALVADDADGGKWAQYGFDYLLKPMTPEAKSFIRCAWWDSMARKTIEGAGADCNIRLRVVIGTNSNGGQTCAFEPRGNMANLAEN